MQDDPLIQTVPLRAHPASAATNHTLPHSAGPAPRCPHALATAPAWYCLRSQPKREHIAAASLRRLQGIEVFNPRLRVRKLTRRGPVWFIEPLFPCYVFARFELSSLIVKVLYAFGVAEVVHFGARWPAVPDNVVDDLRARFGDAELHPLPPVVRPGDEVRIAAGPFLGLVAVVHRYQPSSQRVQVLLEFLGRLTVAELDVRGVVGATRYPEQLAAAPGERWTASGGR